MIDTFDGMGTAMIHTDLSDKDLINLALERNEGVLASNQALRVTTGARTGRSPKDRFIVKDAETSSRVAWGDINRPISENHFETLWKKVSAYIDARDHFISHLHVGADPKHYIPVTVITEHAWQNLFAKQLFIREKVDIDDNHPSWTVMSAPNYMADPATDGTNSDAAVLINFSKRRVLICGTHYAGEIKKAMFSVLNYFLPEEKILPMHCSANVGESGDVALFFGLSGTGKTTLSADPNRRLIGDDEHGWGACGVFNFEGGCYAKCIHLSQEKEPVIYHAIRSGAIMENVVLDENGNPDYDDNHLSENTRCAYPREHIECRVPENLGNQPQYVIFLTCDLFGVLPPVAKLNKEQAAYYFLSGYTALVGSTEVGSNQGIMPTFSHCFGAPFFPRPTHVYADLLINNIEQSAASVYLVNTGWTQGAYGKGGHRFPIPTTRQIINTILNGDADNAVCTRLPHFNLQIPNALPGVDSNILNPRNTWADTDAYDETAKNLIHLFNENFTRHQASDAIKAAAPRFDEKDIPVT